MRCFVAVELPPPVRAAAARVQRELRAAAPEADARWVDPAAFHVTLKFLGEVPDGRVAGVVEALRDTAAGAAPFVLSAAGTGAFPSPRRPRVVWIGLGGDTVALARLAAAVDQGLAGLGFVPEARAYSAHLTIARVRSPRGLARLPEALVDEARGAPLGSWTVADMVLMRSHLRPTGAVYEPAARLPFAGAVA